MKKDKEEKMKKSALKKAEKSAMEKSLAKEEPHAVMVQDKNTALAVPLKGSLSADVLKHPVVTEKTAVGETDGKYVFRVSPGATKGGIKVAVTEAYGVKPVSVNISNVEGKSVRYGRTSGKRQGFKKATVTLPKGKTIAIHEGV